MEFFVIVAEAGESSSGISGWKWFFLILFFLFGFFFGLFVWRRSAAEAYVVEQENRRLHAAFQKREKSYKENRETVSSVLGQDALHRR